MCAELVPYETHYLYFSIVLAAGRKNWQLLATRLLRERGHLLRSYRLMNKILCLKQALARHDLNIYK